jgi:mannose-6-phosphate isomerase-like protein (cupin superfamily)
MTALGLNGMHLTGRWNRVEYVVLPPGSSCGEHVHRATEEIYYILAGAPVMHIDGERVDVQAGDVITETIGAAHTITNHGDHDMEMYVIEVFPGGAEARLHFGDRVVTGGRGLCAGIPPGTSRRIENRSPTEPLELLSAEVYANSSEVA